MTKQQRKAAALDSNQLQFLLLLLTDAMCADSSPMLDVDFILLSFSFTFIYR